MSNPYADLDLMPGVRIKSLTINGGPNLLRPAKPSAVQPCPCCGGELFTPEDDTGECECRGCECRWPRLLHLGEVLAPRHQLEAGPACPETGAE